MLKIAFIWYFDKAGKVFDNWRDGLRSAMELIGNEHKVSWFLDKTLPDPKDKYDFYLVWDDSNTETTALLPKDARKGICLTTDPTNIPNLLQFDVVFCESQPVFDQARANGLHAIKAFGTDTEFFKPNGYQKSIEYFYPATFSPWKRQSEIAYLGEKLLCVGTLQPDGTLELAKCVEKGVKVEIGYFPAIEIKKRYGHAKHVIIPAVHGSERTVLEAMSMDIKPEVLHKENAKTYSYITELEESGLKPREFVLQNYSHEIYAKQLLKGICG